MEHLSRSIVQNEFIVKEGNFQKNAHSENFTTLRRRLIEIIKKGQILASAHDRAL